jgi:hypothetical protein
MEKAETIRGDNWLKISQRVLDHIENYTIPQYGDAPDDAIEEWSIEECFKQPERYLARRNTSMRPKEKALDILKSIHYLSLALEKIEKEGEKDVKSYTLNWEDLLSDVLNARSHDIYIEGSKDEAIEEILKVLRQLIDKCLKEI